MMVTAKQNDGNSKTEIKRNNSRFTRQVHVSSKNTGYSITLVSSYGVGGGGSPREKTILIELTLVL